MTCTRHARPAGRTIGALALSALLLTGCDDDPTDVGAPPELAIEASAAEFASTDPYVGTDETIVVEARNDGGGSLTLTDFAIEGTNASDFRLVAAESTTLGAGESMTFEVAFMPETEGTKTALVVVLSDAPSASRVEIDVRGQAARFQYAQVDRKGIPGLNTVFNHPSGTGPFDKRAYNVASPADDVATYTDQFETVLGAVGNADPAGTAALLLPDELPVSLGASPTAFASLTGRALADDAVDVALFVTVGEPSLQSDNVDANDKAFSPEFPYVATPHE